MKFTPIFSLHPGILFLHPSFKASLMNCYYEHSLYNQRLGICLVCLFSLAMVSQQANKQKQKKNGNIGETAQRMSEWCVSNVSADPVLFNSQGNAAEMSDLLSFHR